MFQFQEERATTMKGRKKCSVFRTPDVNAHWKEAVLLRFGNRHSPRQQNTPHPRQAKCQWWPLSFLNCSATYPHWRTSQTSL